MAREVRERTGIRLTVEGPCGRGQVGAAYVRGPDGRRSVLTWRPGTTATALRGGPWAVVDALRGLGYPAPALEAAVDVAFDADAVVLVQELLPGAEPGRFTGALLDRALEANARQAGALERSPAVPPVRLHLGGDGAGYCLHEPLRRHSPATAALERRISALADGHPDTLPGDDAVHYDFHPGNLLADGDRLTGVVDWDGAGRGDRRLDLVTLRFGLHAREVEPGVAERLDAILDTVPEAVLRPAWAHMSLRMVDWAIRHHTAGEVEEWLAVARQRL